MNLQDLKRLIRPITNKIFLLLGRAVLKAIDNSEDTQKIQVIALKDETISEIERFQEYGFEGYPFVDAEAFIGFLNGNRDHGIALVVHDGRYRPTDLTEGEVAIYTDEDVTAPFRIQMKRGRIHFRQSNIEDVDIDTSKTEDIGTSKAVTVPIESHINTTSFGVTTPKATLNATEVALGGAVFAALRSLIDERFIALFNTHIHAGVTAGGASTAIPTVLMDAASHATAKVKGE